MNTGPLVSLSGISKKFGKKKVIDDVSLDLHEGEIVGLVGRSGCGKSTLIKILVGYYRPDKGSMFFSGKKVSPSSRKVKELVGYTTQENSFYEKLTIQENMAYYANLYGVKQKKKRINELLTAVGLSTSRNTLAGKISGGMKRRLDFAISLIHGPKLVILDEPMTGLDPILVDNFWEIVTTIAKEQKITVLVSSHLLDEIKRYCSRALVMSNGSIASIPLTKKTDIEKRFVELTS